MEAPVMLQRIRQQIILWLGDEVVGRRALQEAAHVGAYGVLRDMLAVADDYAEQGRSLRDLIDVIALNKYHARSLLDEAITRHLNPPASKQETPDGQP